MNISTFLELQKKNLMFHRFSYIIYLFYIIVCRACGVITDLRFMVIAISMAVLAIILEEALCYLNFFNNIWVVRIFRFLQFGVATCGLMTHDGRMYSAIVYLSLIILFIFDILATIDLGDLYVVILTILSFAVPLLAIGIFQKVEHRNEVWFFYLLSSIIFLLVIAKTIFSVMNILKEYNDDMLKQKLLISEIENSNLDLLEYQKKIQSVNEELNIQKLEIERAYKQVNQVNYEMTMQADMLKYVASSFDVPKIINTIADSVLSVKNPGFCAIYIGKNVYLNKYANLVVKTSIASLHHKIKDDITFVYEDIKARGSDNRIIKDEDLQSYDFISNININAILVMPLLLDGEMYGLLMVGDQHENAFDKNISYYEATIAQFNIAVKNARIYNQIEDMARKDGLTGINNRTYFNMLFSDAVSEVLRKDTCISVALFDIDHFKRVNDTYGHLMGDEVIKQIARTFERVIEEYGGFVCRYGGEEFVAVLPHKNIEISLPIIEELHDKIAALRITYDGVTININVSVGLTSYPETCDNTSDLLKRADWTMYYSKEHGRGCITVDNENIV